MAKYAAGITKRDNVITINSVESILFISYPTFAIPLRRGLLKSATGGVTECCLSLFCHSRTRHRFAIFQTVSLIRDIRCTKVAFVVPFIRRNSRHGCVFFP
jgi:hypothetical protein